MNKLKGAKSTQKIKANIKYLFKKAVVQPGEVAMPSACAGEKQTGASENRKECQSL